MGGLIERHAQYVSVAIPFFEVYNKDVIWTLWVRSGERRGFAYNNLKLISL